MKQQRYSSRAIVDRILFDVPNADRKQAIADWIQSRKGKNDKKADAEYLCQRISKESEDWRRTWCITALTAFNRAETIDPLLTHLKGEKFEWARYWGTVGLGKMMLQTERGDEFKAYLVNLVHQDPSPSVRAVALRLLIENKFLDECLDIKQLQAFPPAYEGVANETGATIDPLHVLTKMMSDPDWEKRRAACKALRSAASTSKYDSIKAKVDDDKSPVFEVWVESKLLPEITRILHDRFELGEVRYQAAHAIRNIKHPELQADVADALSDALTLRRDLRGMARRICLSGLEELETPDVKEALLFALEDDDAEIRQRAAKALKHLLDDGEAVDFIIQYLLRIIITDQVPDEAISTEYRRYRKYMEALRQIDAGLAAEHIAAYLLHPDPDLSKQAERALIELGGEAASRTLQAQRMIAMNTYTDLLGKADERIMELFERLMSRAQVAFAMSMGMHGIIFFLGVITLAASLYISLGNFEDWFLVFVGSVGSIGSLGVLLYLFYRDPIKNIRHSLNNLVKVNVVFLGYIRRINQIDATFKHLFLDTKAFNLQKMQLTVKEIDLAVEKTLVKIETYLEGRVASVPDGRLNPPLLDNLAQELTSHSNNHQPGKAEPAAELLQTGGPDKEKV